MRTVVTAVRCGYGLLLAARPDLAGRLLGGRPVDAAERRVLRVLGARHVAQAGLAAYRPGLARVASLVDAAHAASLVGLAAVDPGRRRYALADLAITLGLGAAEARPRR